VLPFLTFSPFLPQRRRKVGDHFFSLNFPLLLCDGILYIVEEEEGVVVEDRIPLLSGFDFCFFLALVQGKR